MPNILTSNREKVNICEGNRKTIHTHSVKFIFFNKSITESFEQVYNLTEDDSTVSFGFMDNIVIGIDDDAKTCLRCRKKG